MVCLPFAVTEFHAALVDRWIALVEILLPCQTASAVWVVALLMALIPEAAASDAVASGHASRQPPPRHFVTNALQFGNLSGTDYINGCDFRLSGVVTLVDTNRDLVVIQDATGAAGLHLFPLAGNALEAGHSVMIEATDCVPYFPRWPSYPHHPSSLEIRSSFEAPSDWGTYHLTRMRGFLRAPETGEYRFWIASDNSSELWLSSDSNPANARIIASLARFEWVAPRQWSRYPSQRSEPIHLTGGETYYIEALQEQTTGGENLAVAWQGPSLAGGVIEGEYLVPWDPLSAADASFTNGILRESWTNYSIGSVSGMGGARAFDSIVSIKRFSIRDLGPGKKPVAQRIALSQRLARSENFAWVQVEGFVNFATMDGSMAFLELTDGQTSLEVRVPNCDPRTLQQFKNAIVRIEGVCESMREANGSLVPVVIWGSTFSGVEIVKGAAIHLHRGGEISGQPLVSTDPAMQGFYGTRGVVTFNDRVFGTDHIFVQEDSAVVRVIPTDPSFDRRMKLGQWVELGGALDAGSDLPTISPLVLTELEFRPLPVPIAQPLRSPMNVTRHGRWCELEGVVRSVNSNGTLSVMSKDGAAYLWIGKFPSNQLARYVDSAVRARGVLLQNILDAPTILSPSSTFISVDRDPPMDPLEVPLHSIRDLTLMDSESLPIHRVRVAGELTFAGSDWFFVQDPSGGIRVRALPPENARPGDPIQVIGFPSRGSGTCVLVNVLVRSGTAASAVQSSELDLADALSTKQKGTLVHTMATVLACKTNGSSSVVELQEHQRVFAAWLQNGALPLLVPGSRVKVTGVLNDEAAVSVLQSNDLPKGQTGSSLTILMRDLSDLTVLRGPPWWTWKRAATLVGALLFVLAVSLLWIHLLRRRLERQHAAQLVFSRQVLQRVEDERRRIAANLHDSLGQTLLVIKNQAIMASHSPPEPELRDRLDQISGATSSALEEIRQITHGLRPYQLDRLGLTQAIRALVGRASETSSILFASRVEEIDGLFDKEAEINVYRILQEAITNVVKHSGATEAAVVIRKRGTLVSISIRDNGCGFDPATESPDTHDLGYGLSGISERARILHGSLVIESRPGGGTSLTMEVPSSFS
ncbi:MAG TPA: histidine kinase [Verrucomicrobiae bacterium]|nr:histidine kinase [Verrucomicrobiae bacterium]